MQTTLSQAQMALYPTLIHCKQQLMQHYGPVFDALILYGSAARGELTPDSDIDLLVLLNSPLDYFKELRTIVDLLYPIQLEASHWISAKPATREDFTHGLTQLYRNIEQDGILL